MTTPETETPNPYEAPEDYQDRRGRLAASGILFGLFGLMLVGTGALSVVQYGVVKGLGAVASTDPQALPDGTMDLMELSMVVNVVFYGGAGIVMIAIGYGSLFLKRWSRTLALTAAWVWLYMGVVSLLSTVGTLDMVKEIANASMEEATNQMGGGGAGTGALPAASPPVPQMDAIFGVVMAIMIVVMAIFMILVPGILLWLNWSRDVRITLEVADRKPRWTDRQPTPVIGLAVVAAFFGVVSLTVVPMMGQPWMEAVLPGGPAKYLILLVPLVWLYVAWGSYRRQVAAWALAGVALIGGSVWGIVSFRRFDYTSLYRDMGMPEADAAMMGELISNALNPSQMTVMMVVSMLPLLGALAWLGRYFFGKTEEATAS